MLWRPGCPYCSRLRRGLARAVIDTVERDIWADPAAAARVRSATGGDETVPTVIVGTQALVNPSVGMVVAAVRAEFPDDAQALVGAVSPGARPQAGGPGWTAAVGLVWLLLALWRPTTTWHLAPVLLAGAWPWVTAWDLRAGDRSGAARLVLAGTVGFAASRPCDRGTVSGRSDARAYAPFLSQSDQRGVGPGRGSRCADRAGGAAQTPSDGRS